MISDEQELFKALEARDSGAIIGTTESQWLEAKRSPYHLESPERQLEFFKDVTAIATADGGVILIGFATGPATTALVDVMTELTPVRPDIVSLQKRRDLIESGTPPPVGAEFNWWLENGANGVLTVTVPRAESTQYPILAHKVRAHGARNELLMASLHEGRHG